MADLTPEDTAAILKLADQLPEPGQERAGPLAPDGESLYSKINQTLSEIRSEAGRGIEKLIAGSPARFAETEQRPPMNLASKLGAQLVNPMPGSIPQAAMMAGGPLIGSLGRGKLATGALTGGLDAALGYAEGGLPGAALGGTGGFLGGTLGQGARNLGRPNQVTRALLSRGEKVGKIVSPTVKTAMGNFTEDPAILTSGATLWNMRKGASTEIQKVFDSIESSLPANTLIALEGLTPGQLAKHGTVGLQGTPGVHPGTIDVTVPFKEALKIVQGIKAAEDPAWHRLEGLLARQVEPYAPQQFRSALNQYRLDQTGITAIAEVQAARELRGGINPTDQPGIAESETALFGAPAGTREPIKAGLYGLKAALMGPRNVFGINAAANAVKAAMGGGGEPIATQRLGEPGFLQKLMGGSLGVGLQAAPGIPRFQLLSTDTGDSS